MTLFTVRVDHHIHIAGQPASPDPLPLLGRILVSLNEFEYKHMTTQAELAAKLTALAEQTNKAKAEVLGKLSDLAQALANAGNASPEVEAAFAALSTAVQGVDDIVPDPVPETPADPAPAGGESEG
jgi:hypothetical protein